MSINAFSAPSLLFKPVRSQDEDDQEDRSAASLRYLLGRFFGCWHRKMTRPFTRGKCTYRTCSRCGMRRDFDLKTWKMKGRYYREPVRSPISAYSVPSDLEISPSRNSQTQKLHLLR